MRMTRSTDRRLMPQYSCACSSWRDQREIFDVLDAQQHDGQIAGNALRPQTLRARRRRAGCCRAEARAAGVGEQDVPGQLLEQIGLRGVDAEMPQLHLRLRPGQRGRARVRVRVAMLVGEIEQLARGSARRRSRTRCAPCRRRERAARYRSANTASSTVPGGAGQRAAFEHGQRCAQLAAASDETAPDRFRTPASPHGGAFDHGVMRSPDFRFIGRAAPAVGEQRALAREVFGAHEHLRESRVRHVGCLGRRAPVRHTKSLRSRAARIEALLIDSRRTSASSSGDTCTSSVVVRSPSMRMISARSSVKLTS